MAISGANESLLCKESKNIYFGIYFDIVFKIESREQEVLEKFLHKRAENLTMYIKATVPADLS